MLSHKPHKKWNKKKPFLIEKRIFFFLITKKENNKRLLYICTFFFLEEREGVYFKLKYLLSYLQFFFKKKYPKTFLVNQYEQKLLSFVFPITLLFFFSCDCNIIYLIIKKLDEEFGL